MDIENVGLIANDTETPGFVQVGVACIRPKLSAVENKFVKALCPTMTMIISTKAAVFRLWREIKSAKHKS